MHGRLVSFATGPSLCKWTSAKVVQGEQGDLINMWGNELSLGCRHSS